MYPLVYKYLVLHKKVSVPGVGNFLIDSVPAHIAGEQLLQPTVSHIQFKPETALADKNFYEFLAAEMHVEEIDAIKQFHEFAYELKGNIGYADGVQFPGIGTLRKQPSGSFLFEEESGFVDFYRPIKIAAATVEADAIVHKHTTTDTEPDFSNIELTPVDALEEPKKDYWWVYALALAAIGIAAIVYKMQ